MDFGTILGLIAGVGIIFLGILRQDGDVAWFWSLNSFIIVLGGTIAASMVNYPIKNILGLFSVVKNVFSSDENDYQGIIEEIVEKGEKARKNGVLSLEADLTSIESTFLRNGIELAINERDPARLRNYLNLELSNIQKRHKMGQEIFFYLGSYAPAFGMLGTVMGLIVMMNNFSGGNSADVSSIDFDVAQKFAQLLGGMGLALITTFYGVLLSNLVFLPIGGKLTRKSQEEMMLKSIVVEGIISIHSKEHPILMREKLRTFVPQSSRQDDDEMSSESYGMSAAEAKAKSTAWAVTYADLVPLLLTFFILLLVILNDAEKHIDRVINMLLDETYKELKENIESSYVSVDRVTKGVKITLASGRLFKSMDDDVQPLVYPLLRQIGGIVRVSKVLNVYDDDKFANLLTAIEKRGGFLNVEIRCEGHTDDLPLPKNAPFQSNWDLSTSRALNIVKLLSDFSRIPESKFSAMGYGEHRPVLPVSSIGKNSVDIRKARAKNRRVEIYMDAFIKQNTITN